MKTSPKKASLLATFDADQSSNIARASVVRSPREDETSGQIITFRCSDVLLAAVESRARSEHRNRTGLIRHALWTYLHETETEENSKTPSGKSTAKRVQKASHASIASKRLEEEVASPLAF
jgi:hypothetical protein